MNRTHQAWVLVAALPALLVGCARSSVGGGGGGDEVAAAAATAAEAKADVADLATRTDTVETDVGDARTRLDAVETGLSATQADVTALDTRVTDLENGGGVGGGGRDDLVLIDDPAAAGFPVAQTPANLEEGLAALNGRVDTQTTRTDAIEVQFNANLATTVTQTVQAEIANVQVQVDAPDVSFDPAAEVTDPRADALDNVPEYPFSQNLDEAVRALRWAHQVRFVPPGAPTLLGLLPRNYAQEAIEKLDTELYDVRDGPVILGVSADTTGNIAEGALVGWQAADEKCAVAFAASRFAHACTLDEAQRALGGERYVAADFAAPVTAWTTVTSAGAAANCDGGLNGQNGGTGYAVTVDLTFAGTDATGPALDVASGVACDTAMPLLCCR